MKAISYDNRGTANSPYGFVYFDDGRRVVYSGLTGVTDGTGGWDPVTPAHKDVATKYLQDNGILK